MTEQLIETNQCLLCLNEEDTKLYNHHFGCKCKSYFHEECWKIFVKRRQKCPFCNKEIVNTVNINYKKILSFYTFVKLGIFFFELGLFVFCLIYFLVNNEVFQQAKGFTVFFFISSMMSITYSILYVSIDQNYDDSTKKLRFNSYYFLNLIFSACILINFIDTYPYLTNDITDEYDLNIANFFLVCRVVITFLPILNLILLHLLVYFICGSEQFRILIETVVR